MKPERFLITTSKNGRSYKRIWNSSSPLALGHPFQWILEKTSQGVRIRSLVGKSEQVISGSSVTLSQEMLASGHVAKLNRPGENNPLLLGVQPIQPIKAEDFLKEKSSLKSHGGKTQLQAFACVGNSVISTEKVESTYIGRAEGEKVFKIRRSRGQYRIKPLSEGLDSTRNGQTSVLDRSSSQFLSAEELAQTVITQGPCSWHFVRVPQPAGIPFRDKEKDREAIWFRTVLSAVFSAFVLFTVLIQFIPKPEEKPEELLPPQLAKIILKKPRGIPRAPSPAPDAIQRDGKTETADAGKMEGQESKQEVKKEEPAPQKKAAEPKKPEPKKEPKPPKAQNKKQENKPATPAPTQTTSKAPPKPKAAPQPTPAKAASSPKLAISRGTAIRAAQLRDLQNSVGGLVKGGMSKLLEQSNVLNSGAGSGKDSLDAPGSGLGPTNLNVEVNRRGTQVSGLGGSGMGTQGGGKGRSVGYGSGDYAQIVGKGGSTVSFDLGQAAVEEGLTKEEVANVIYKHMSEIRYCYEASLLRFPNLEGKVFVGFVINGQGKVKTASVKQASVPDPKLSDCVVRRLVTWQFPHPKGGVNVDVSYPFIFKTLGGS